MAANAGLEQGKLKSVVSDLTQVDCSKYNSRASWLLNTANFKAADRTIKTFFEVIQSTKDPVYDNKERMFNSDERTMISRTIKELKGQDIVMVDRNLMFLSTLTQDPIVREKIQYMRKYLKTENQPFAPTFKNQAQITSQEIDQQFRNFEQAVPHFDDFLAHYNPEAVQCICNLQKHWFNFDDRANQAVLLFMFAALDNHSPKEIEHYFNLYVCNLISQQGGDVLKCSTHYDALEICKGFILAFQAGEIADFSSEDELLPTDKHEHVERLMAPSSVEQAAHPVAAFHQSAAINATHDGCLYDLKTGQRFNSQFQPIGDDVVVNPLDSVIDFSHSEPTWGLVVDKALHNKQREPKYVDAFNQFVKQVGEFMDHQVFSGQRLASVISDAARKTGPQLTGSYCFAAIVELDGQKYAAVSVGGDSKVIVAHKDGTVEMTEKVSFNFGDSAGTVQSHLQFIPVEDGDRIIGCSDGVHDYLWTREIIALAKQSPDAEQFLENCKIAIQSHTQEWAESELEPQGEPETPTCKRYCDPKDARRYDDLGAFILVV